MREGGAASPAPPPARPPTRRASCTSPAPTARDARGTGGWGSLAWPPSRAAGPLPPPGERPRHAGTTPSRGAAALPWPPGAAPRSAGPGSGSGRAPAAGRAPCRSWGGRGRRRTCRRGFRPGWRSRRATRPLLPPLLPLPPTPPLAAEASSSQPVGSAKRTRGRRGAAASGAAPDAVLAPAEGCEPAGTGSVPACCAADAAGRSGATPPASMRDTSGTV
mmetsp:Transcript_10110/g.39384  ORF Transcript_10110/g.39384 Transcript_10110/m.39384 type:complete len:219 (+) Transcript_10110:947-1603(+)